MTDFDPQVTKQQIIDFMTDFTVETTPGSAAKTPDYREHLRPGCKIAVTFLPGSDFNDTVATSRRLKEEGFQPMPHFAARSIPCLDFFEENLRCLQGEAGVEHVVALGGAVDNPIGDFSDSMQLLETGLFDKYGIKTIGVAGHPEGSPDISDKGLKDALAWKNKFAENTDACVYIATQFCFEAAPVIEWDRRINAEGNKLPIRIGVPGLATIKTLINHAKACGVGPSMRFLTRQAKNIAKLMSVSAPDQFVMNLAHYRATDPNCGIAGVHIYPLGGMKKSAQWSYAVVDGDFTLNEKGKGFRVEREIG